MNCKLNQKIYKPLHQAVQQHKKDFMKPFRNITKYWISSRMIQLEKIYIVFTLLRIKTKKLIIFAISSFQLPKLFAQSKSSITRKPQKLLIILFYHRTRMNLWFYNTKVLHQDLYLQNIQCIQYEQTSRSFKRIQKGLEFRSFVQRDLIIYWLPFYLFKATVYSRLDTYQKQEIHIFYVYNHLNNIQLICFSKKSQNQLQLRTHIILLCQITIQNKTDYGNIIFRSGRRRFLISFKIIAQQLNGQFSLFIATHLHNRCIFDFHFIIQQGMLNSIYTHFKQLKRGMTCAKIVNYILASFYLLMVIFYCRLRELYYFLIVLSITITFHYFFSTIILKKLTVKKDLLYQVLQIHSYSYLHLENMNKLFKPQINCQMKEQCGLPQWLKEIVQKITIQILFILKLNNKIQAELNFNKALQIFGKQWTSEQYERALLLINKIYKIYRRVRKIRGAPKVLDQIFKLK